jgi:NADH-quinone oxidoreductase subunit N
MWTLVFVLVGTSVIGLFYYLRVVVAIFATEGVAAEGAKPLPSLSFAGGATLFALAIVLIWLGVFPHPIIDVFSPGLFGQ